MEIGPYRLKDDKTLELNDGSWHEFANLLFVDNPVGTGFSYVDTDSYVTELDQMADQFVTFLEKWFAIFPEYEQDDVRTHERIEAIARGDTDLSRSISPESPTLDSISPTSRSTCLNETRSPVLRTSGNSKVS